MTVQTLADLKALNEAAEQAEAAATAEVETDEEAEVLEGELEEQEEEGADTGEETEGEEGEQEEAEDWAKPAEGSVPVAKHVEMKHKLKAKLQSSDDEVARLKAQIEALQAGGVNAQAQQQSGAPVMPKMDDPDVAYDDEKFYQKMAEYNDKLFDYKMASRDQSRAQTSQQEQHNAVVQGGLDKHYERAEALVLAGKVTAENYQAADHVVRKAMTEALPQLGEVVLDNLIARLGDGSEKVIYHLGVNPAALSKLKESFKTDPTGFASSIFLGELKAKFTSAVIDKSSKAPKPDRPLNGTAKVGSNGLHAAYKKSFAASDGKSLSIKREAKAKGIDTSKW
jgi:hypothetical protein